MRKEVNETLVAIVVGVAVLLVAAGIGASRATDPTFASAVTYEASRLMVDGDDIAAPVTYTYNGVEHLGYVEGEYPAGQDVSIVVTPETGEPNYGETGLFVAVILAIVFGLFPAFAIGIGAGLLVEFFNRRRSRLAYRKGSVYNRAMDTVRSV